MAYGPPTAAMPQPQPKKKSKAVAWGCGGCLAVVALIVLIVVIVAVASSGGSSGGTGGKSGAGTITYQVTGSPADVTYGPAGSELSKSVPLHVTDKLGNPTYYAVTAQLKGGGSVTCALLVNGKVISRSTANGSYNIASCEIAKDPFSDKWEDVNKG